MKIIFSFVFFALGNYALADSLCNSKITRELTLCARSNFELSDKRLNIVYDQISLKISGKEKEMLIGSQRKWIIYKEKLCKSAKNQTISGEESEIEKWTCLDDITKTRTKELQYIQSDSGMGDFFHAVDIVSKLYEGGDRNRFIDKLYNKSAGYNDIYWNSYVIENCKLTAARLHEENKNCMARQNFYRY